MIKEILLKVNYMTMKKIFRDKYANLGHRLVCSDEKVVEYFLSKHEQFIEKFGGRGLVNMIDNDIGHLLAGKILEAELYGQRNQGFRIVVNNDGNLSCEN